MVTVSIGIALVRPTLERNPQGAVQLADEALYVAKSEGRNRIKVLVHEHSELTTGQFRHRELRQGS
jgi:predicted signal transduction protein with EAL and GGDEF domain